MDEHDDDLTSEVHEGADLETDSFPDTLEGLDDEVNGDDRDAADVDQSEL